MNDYYTNLNKVMDEIEDNLTSEIHYKKLAKIIGTSDYTLQRVFVFLTGITLTEYIRKRRLTKAAEELQLEENKVIDIALKYQYDSPVSFARAFQKMHNIAPSKVKQKVSIKAFPKIEFKPTEEYTKELEYRIVDLDEQILYGKKTNVIETSDKKSTRDLWKECKTDGSLEFIIQNSRGKEKYYGASEHIFTDEPQNNRKYMNYFILGKEKREDFSKLVIPKCTWAMFRLDSKEQKDILKLINAIYTKWLPSSKFKENLPYPNLEIYYEDYCEYCIAVK